MLPSTIDENGRASARQHLLTIVVDDRVAIDAGCLAFSCSDKQREQVRDIVLTHTHLDHIAGLPMFVDDLFSTLEHPVCVHATQEMIDILERDVFNWSIYPRFSELTNSKCCVLEYQAFERGNSFEVEHLSILSVPVNHEVGACGYIVSDGDSAIAISGDTAETEEFWAACNNAENLKAVLVECAFPNNKGELARVSRHLTPERLKDEITKLKRPSCPVYVINLKPNYRDRVIADLDAADISELQILEIGKVYEF